MRQAPRHLSQGGPQQPRVFVATQMQELHLQQLRGALGTQAQQLAAAPGVQVQTQAVPSQEKGCPGARIRSVGSISGSRLLGLLGLLLLLHRGHRPPAGLGRWTCPSLPGRPAQAGPGEAAESGGGEGRSAAGPSSRAVAWGPSGLCEHTSSYIPAPRLDRSLMKWGWRRAASSVTCARRSLGTCLPGGGRGGSFAPSFWKFRQGTLEPSGHPGWPLLPPAPSSNESPGSSPTSNPHSAALTGPDDHLPRGGGVPGNGRPIAPKGVREASVREETGV